MPDDRASAAATHVAIRPDSAQDFRLGAPLVNRNVTLRGRRTSMRLEPAMWVAIADIKRREGCSMVELCSAIDKLGGAVGFTLAVRSFVLDYFRTAATEDGRARAGHGYCIRAPRGRPGGPPGLQRPV
jgi:predicted DNA-binding ribbon-helix-helix protein